MKPFGGTNCDFGRGIALFPYAFRMTTSGQPLASQYDESQWEKDTELVLRSTYENSIAYQVSEPDWPGFPTSLCVPNLRTAFASDPKDSEASLREATLGYRFRPLLRGRCRMKKQETEPFLDKPFVSAHVAYSCAASKCMPGKRSEHTGSRSTK